jgi:conjugal transfer pilus assembly protein TraI
LAVLKRNQDSLKARENRGVRKDSPQVNLSGLPHFFPVASYAAMKSLFCLFRKPPTPTWASVADEDIPRYPPFAKGLPAASVERILATQPELVDAIRHTLALPHEEFQAVVMPVVERYAAFTHLLPASEAHHHRGAGGLFRHGLEVGYWATMASEGVLFGAGSTPLERKGQEPRWRLAVCLAGLLHDIGKPVSDLSILDREGKTRWNPYLENLTDWAEANGVDRYFLRWRDKRHQRHEQFSVLVTERVLTPECLTYLTQTGPEIMQAMLEAIAGVDRSAMFHALVIEADRKSVERDLKANHLPVDSSLGVPVEKYLLDAMRRLIGNGQWSANLRGARLWRFDEGLHVVWKAGVQDICELLAKDKISGIPRDPDTLADILIERGLAIPRRTQDGRHYRYWRMAPAELDVALYMLRLSSPELIYNGEPPVVVEGRLLEETEKETVVSKREVPKPTIRPEPTQERLVPARLNDTAAPSPAESETDSRTITPKSEPANQSEQTVANDAVLVQPTEEKSAQEQANFAGNSSSGRKRTKQANSESTKSKLDEKPNPPNPAHEQLPPSNKPFDSDGKRNELETEAAHWLASQGLAGEWLLHAAIGTYREPPAVSVRVVDGCVFLPHPDLARKLGKDPGESLRLLDEAGWIETDVLAPMRKIREIDGIRGVMLNREASRCWLALADNPEFAEGEVLKPTVTAPRVNKNELPNTAAEPLKKHIPDS